FRGVELREGDTRVLVQSRIARRAWRRFECIKEPVDSEKGERKSCRQQRIDDAGGRRQQRPTWTTDDRRPKREPWSMDPRPHGPRVRELSATRRQGIEQPVPRALAVSDADAFSN